MLGVVARCDKNENISMVISILMEKFVSRAIMEISTIIRLLNSQK